MVCRISIGVLLNKNKTIFTRMFIQYTRANQTCQGRIVKNNFLTEHTAKERKWSIKKTHQGKYLLRLYRVLYLLVKVSNAPRFSVTPCSVLFFFFCASDLNLDWYSKYIYEHSTLLKAFIQNIPW
jgi:hypothetical protein